MDRPIICKKCGAQYPGTIHPNECLICTDIRSAKPAVQLWTTAERLLAADGYRNLFREKEPGIIAIGTEPVFAAGNRALLIQTGSGNVLWDCINVLTGEAKEEIRNLGAIRAIALSHPHFYTAMADWAEEFDAPVYVHEGGKDWVTQPSDRIQYWSGESKELFGGVTLLHLGGHFPGSAALHWQHGAGGKGILCASDTMQPVADRRWVTFMLSFSNYLPLPAAEVSRIGATVAAWPLGFDRLYGGWWGQVVDGDAKAKVLRSVDRYVGILNGKIDIRYT